MELMARTGAAARRSRYRVGGVAALLLGLGYVATIPLFASVGAPPAGAEARLAYHATTAAAWWAIVGLSVLTDFLYVPVAASLYAALHGFSRTGMALATAFVAMFVALDLAVTWPGYASLIILGADYASAATDAERAALVAAAGYPSAVLSSGLQAVYSVLTLSIGILLTGLVMTRGVFPRLTAYLGVATGVVGIASVAETVLTGSVSVATIVASVLTTVWLVLAGFELVRLRPGATEQPAAA